MLTILCYRNQGIHWYPCHPTSLWKINFRLVWRLISALIWDISGLGNRSDGRDFREKRTDTSRFLTLYIKDILTLASLLTVHWQFYLLIIEQYAQVNAFIKKSTIFTQSIPKFHNDWVKMVLFWVHKPALALGGAHCKGWKNNRARRVLAFYLLVLHFWAQKQKSVKF